MLYEARVYMKFSYNNLNMIVRVDPIIAPQNIKYNKISVEYSDGKMTLAKNIDIAISNTEGN